MVRKQEQPADVDPDVTPSAAEARRRRKREAEERRKQEEAEEESKSAEDTESEEPSDSENPEADTERVRRELAAEAEFRERVALRTLAERFPAGTFEAIERVLAATSLEWRLEKGRYLFTHLVAEREVVADDTPVRITQRLAISRETPPVDPDDLERRVAAVIEPSEPVERNVELLERVRPELAPEDEIRITLAPDQPEIVVTSEAVRVAESRKSEAAPVPVESPEHPPAETPPPDPKMAERVLKEVEAEPVEPRAPELESDKVAKTEEVPKRVESVGDVLDVLEQEAVSLNDLPPIRGGEFGPDEPAPPDLPIKEPEAEIELPEEPPLEPEGPADVSEAPFPPAPAAERPRRSTRPPEILQWELGWAEAVRYPDAEMRRKGRKLIRRLAAEYGLRLTPDMEAYLLSLLLRPRLIGGRKVYGLGLNMETLLSVMQVLKYQFNFTRPRT